MTTDGLVKPPNSTNQEKAYVAAERFVRTAQVLGDATNVLDKADEAIKNGNLSKAREYLKLGKNTCSAASESIAREVAFVNPTVATSRMERATNMVMRVSKPKWTGLGSTSTSAQQKRSI